MRFVPIKTAEQQSVLSLHRRAKSFVKARTGQANQIRGLLGEYGVVIPQGIGYVAERLPQILEDGENSFDPGVLHRDSFAKYAAAFFTISRSSLVLASSRRNRAFSASTSETDRLTATAAPSAALSLPARLNLIQFTRLDSGMPNRLAAGVPPIDSPSLTASTFNSALYRRFPTKSFLLISSSVHQKFTINLMYILLFPHHDRHTVTAISLFSPVFTASIPRRL